MKREKLRPRYASNSHIFEKRGDPWITEREGVKDFHRNPEIENPELDFDQRFHNTGFGPKQAAPHPERHDPKPAPKADDFQRRKASIARRMNMRMKARAPKEVEPAPDRGFKPCPGCKAAQCIQHGRCFGADR